MNTVYNGKCTQQKQNVENTCILRILLLSKYIFAAVQFVQETDCIVYTLLSRIIPVTFKIHAAVQFVQETDCIVYTLLKKFAFFSEYTENYLEFQKIPLTRAGPTVQTLGGCE